MLLSLVLGDGCLHYIKWKDRTYGGLTIDHGLEQADYQAWKAQLLSHIVGRRVKVRSGHRGKSVQVSVSWKRFKAWRKFIYPNGKKDLQKILPFINNPEFALAVWLMDDGYVEGSKNKRTPNSPSARFRIFTCSQPEDKHQGIIDWFKTNFDTTVKIKYIRKKSGKTYPYIKFNQEDSLKMWGKIREFVLQFKSMQYKFRFIEQVYQLRVVQRTPDRRYKI